eukprot:gene19600-23189_t
MSMISQGAEGRLFEVSFLDKAAVCKERLRKSYRVSVLDEKLNKQRILQEARCIHRCFRQGVPVPIIYHVDLVDFKIFMERINGITLKELLRQLEDGDEGSANISAITTAIGKGIGLMHDCDVVHGDLTTSNIMVRRVNESDQYNSVVFVDFGLGAMKATPEDKAVDLYVLERAFISTHPNSESLVQSILESYRFGCRTGTAVLLRLEQVRLRGRKIDMIGLAGFTS